MPFPGSLTLITLSGTLLDGEGNPRQGTVVIRLPAPIRSQGDDVIVPPFDLTVQLIAGAFSVQVPATTDPDWTPNTAQYVVQATFSDFSKLWWQFPLPHGGGTLDLADVGDPNVGTPTTGAQPQPVADGGYKAVWVSGTLYRTGDTVQHGSSVYGALRSSTAVIPGTDATMWRIYPSSGGGGGAVASVFGRTGDVGAQSGDYAKAQVGLGNADNTSDLDKPVSTAQQAALDLKASLASPTFTGTVGGIAKAMVGLSNVDNTADLAKPVSTIIQTALDGKSNLGHGHDASTVVSGTFVIARIPTGTTGSTVPLGNDARLSDTRTPTDGTVTTAKIADANVTLAKLANIADATVLGNNTGGPGAPVVLTAAQAKALLAIAQSDVAGLTAALAALAPLASPALTGLVTAAALTLSGRYLMIADALADAATIAINASLGNDFTVTLGAAVGATRVLGAPTNAVGNMKIMIAIRQDATGNRAMTYNAVWRFGADVPNAVLSTGPNVTDYLGARYHPVDGRWDVIAFVRGY